MTGKEIIKMLMEEETVTNAQLAKKLGITQATMWARLNNQSAKDLPLTVFTEMLNALGYDMVIRKGKTENAKDIIAQIDAPTKAETRGRPKSAESKRMVGDDDISEVTG